MSKASPEIEAKAAQRLAHDEARITGNRRTSQSLGNAGAAFWRHPSPWLIAGVLVAGGVARGFVHRFSWTELIVPVILVLLFPVIEWVIHVALLHWRPRRVAGVRIDPLVSRMHRAHHADPRDIPLVFVPWQALTALLASFVAVGLLAFPNRAAGLTYIVWVSGMLFVYEWMHYLIHSDYRPRTRPYRSVWRAHRLHHYKNEHYWFTVTTTGTADRWLHTLPDPATVATSPTVRQLYAQETEQRRQGG